VSALHWQSATALAEAIAARDLSPVALVEHLLERAAALDPTLNVYIRIDSEAALAAARVSEQEAARGRLRGPLHGVPVGIKDIIDVQGLPSTCHSKILLDHVATEDAIAVANLRAAGAIILGKLSTHEFAIGGPSFDLPFPPARNPWNPAHHPGGSSSGSGAGLAAGLFPLALGSDTGGSIRNPASCCGVVGLKPTYGAVSRRGVFPLSYTLDHVGPMAREVADIARLFDVIAGVERPTVADLDRGIAHLRVGFVRHFHETDMPADPAMAAALADAATVLAKQGAIVTDVTLPDLNLFSAVNRTILNAEAWSIHADWLRSRPEDYAQSTRQRLMVGAFVSAGEYVQAQRLRRQLIAAVEDAFRDVDVLLCASSMEPACRIDDEAAVLRSYPRQARTPFNVTGHPAIALMSGLSPDGLPLAIQLAAPYHAEGRLLRVARTYEQATPWHREHPKL
jgi:aspartyl-tRNA(Asn)/glutamyl-tRNA(Gln) amidotransferase subunit A